MAERRKIGRAQSMAPSRQPFIEDGNEASVSHLFPIMREARSGKDTSSLAPATRLLRSLTNPAINQRSVRNISFVRGEAISVGLGWTRGSSKLPGVQEEVSGGINSLPDECLIQIIANVTGLKAYVNFKLVCKRWCNLAKGALRSLQVNNVPHDKLMPLLKSLGNFSNLLTLQLTQEAPNSFNNEMLALLGKACPQLKTLHLSFPDSAAFDFDVEAKSSPAPVPIPDSGSNTAAREVSEAGFNTLFESCLALEELTIACIDPSPSSSNQCAASEPPIPAPFCIPDSVGQLRNLSAFALYSHRVVRLPDSFGELRKLKELSLSCRNLVELPGSMRELVNLETLNLASCQKLECLPDSLTGLERLSKITLKSCHSLVRLPEGMGGMKDLSTLDCQDCDSLENLPDSLGDLEELTSLDLQGCSTLRKLPRSLSGASNLKTINILGCVALKIDPVLIEDIRFSSSCQFQGLEAQVGFLCR